LGNNSTVKYCDHIKTQGKLFYEKAVTAGMEGIMAKRADSLYRPGTRTKEWLKIKNVQSHEAVIIGYTKPRGSRSFFGALLLAKYEEGVLQYIGHTGTGFTEQTLKDVWNVMQPLKSNSSPVKENIKVNAPVTWIKPKLVAELHYTEMTESNRMRHPVFMRLRPDRDAKQFI